MKFIHWMHKIPDSCLGAGINVVAGDYPGLWVVPCVADPRTANGSVGMSTLPEAVWTSRPFGVEIEVDETACVFYRRGQVATVSVGKWRLLCSRDDNGIVIPVRTPYRVVKTWEASWMGNVLEVVPASWTVPDGEVQEAYLSLDSAEEACAVLDRLATLGGSRPSKVFLNFEEDKELVEELYGLSPNGEGKDV